MKTHESPVEWNRMFDRTVFVATRNTWSVATIVTRARDALS